MTLNVIDSLYQGISTQLISRVPECSPYFYAEMVGVIKDIEIIFLLQWNTFPVPNYKTFRAFHMN